MNKDSLNKLKALRKDEKEKTYQDQVKKLKGLTLLYPDKAVYWHMLGVTQMKMGKNLDGLKSLAVAKKLGSTKSLAIIVDILKQFSSVNPELAKKLQCELIGEDQDV